MGGMRLNTAVRLGPLGEGEDDSDPIINNNNTSVTDQGNGFYRVTKTGGGDAWGTGGAVGTVALTGDFIITAKALATNKSCLVGVDVAPTTDDNFTGMDRGFAFSTDGNLYRMVDGVFATILTGYSTANYYFLSRTGTSILITHNTVDDYATSSVINETTPSYAGTCYFDSAIFEVGAMVDVKVQSL